MLTMLRLPRLGGLGFPGVKRFLMVFIAVGIAVGSALGLKGWAFKNQPLEQVLVASRDILAYKAITVDDLGYVSMPAGSRQAGAVQDPRQVIGKTALTPIYRGEQILLQKLEDSSLVVNSGERKISVPVDAVGAVGMSINAGDRVDVYWVPEKQENEKAGQDLIPGKLIATGAVVVDVKNKSAESLLGEIRASLNTTQANNRNGNDKSPAIVVLKVKESEAATLAGASVDGKIILAKKGGEGEHENTGGQ